MVAYTKPQQRKKEERKRLRGERGQIKFIHLRFERWQVVVIGLRKARRILLPQEPQTEKVPMLSNVERINAFKSCYKN